MSPGNLLLITFSQGQGFAIIEVCPRHIPVNRPGRYTRTGGPWGEMVARVHSPCVYMPGYAYLVYVCVCVWLLPSVADTFCVHSHQQMPPDCSLNNQLYMPNLMSRRQIRGGIRTPGPRRTPLPSGLKEQFHRGRQPGTQLVRFC